MFLKLSLNYPRYPFISGALNYSSSHEHCANTETGYTQAIVISIFSLIENYTFCI